MLNLNRNHAIVVKNTTYTISRTVEATILSGIQLAKAFSYSQTWNYIPLILMYSEVNVAYKSIMIHTKSGFLPILITG
jgi:hypothetical protein